MVLPHQAEEINEVGDVGCFWDPKASCSGHGFRLRDCCLADLGSAEIYHKIVDKLGFQVITSLARHIRCLKSQRDEAAETLLNIITKTVSWMSLQGCDIWTY